MKAKLTKQEIEEKIKKTFTEGASAKEIKKIKKIAASKNIKLGKLRKRFCKKCYSMDLKVKTIKNKMKTVECKKCGNIMRWKIKTS